MADKLRRIFDASVTIQAGAASVAGFGTIAVIDDGNDFGGDRTKSFSTLQAVNDDTGMTSECKAYLQEIFKRDRVPTPIIAVAYDSTVPETIADAMNEARAEVDFYWVGTSSRTDADSDNLIDWAISGGDGDWLLFPCVQTSNADAITNGYPSAFSGVETSTRKCIIYEADDDLYLDAQWLAAQAATDFAQFAVSGSCILQGGTQASSVGDTAADNLDDNGIAWFGTLRNSSKTGDVHLYRAPATSTEAAYVQITADYALDRLDVEFAALIGEAETENSRIPGGVEGEAVIAATVDAALAPISGDGDAAWLSPTEAEGFGGRAYSLSLSYAAGTQTWSGTLRLNIRDSVKEIDLTGLLGRYTA